MLVLPVEAAAGVPARLAAVVTSALTHHAARLPNVRVISYQEVHNTLSQEQVRQVAGCTDASCAAEIAGALNTDEIVLGSLGMAGDAYVLTLARVKARSAQVSGRALERVPQASEQLLIDRMPFIVAGLFNTPPPVPEEAAPARVSPRPRGRVALWCLGGAGVVGAALGATAAAALLALFGGMALYDNVPPRTGTHRIPQTAAAAADVAFYASLVLGATAAVSLLAGSVTLAAAWVIP